MRVVTIASGKAAQRQPPASAWGPALASGPIVSCEAGGQRLLWGLQEVGIQHSHHGLLPSGSLAGVPAWRRGHDTNWLKRAVPRALEALFAQ